MKKISKKTIILITVLLIVCSIVGISIGKYLFELTHPNIDLFKNLIY